MADEDNKTQNSGTTNAGNTGDDKSVKKTHLIIPPHPKTTFDEKNFSVLLEGSISLTLEEKQRVIDAIPRLSIDQINELIKIFEEEKVKFAELEKEYGDDVKKLKAERQREFISAEDKKEEMSEAEEEAAQAEALKKQLGL